MKTTTPLDAQAAAEPKTPERAGSWDGEVAWKNVLASSSSRWFAERGTRHWPQTAAARLERAVVLPEVSPQFQLRREDAIFTIGSCFARNIENHLVARGYKVATRPVDIPNLEFRPPTSAVVLNKFTTHSMLNELRWALEPGAVFPEDSLVDEREGEWVDLQVVPEVKPAERAVVLSRRPHITDIYRRVRDCRVVILTLGLVEAWYDNELKLYLNRAPGYWAVKRHPGRFSFHLLDYRANRDALEEIRSLLVKSCAPGVRIVVSVSPVPLSETFTGGDVLQANTYSKCTLRAVAGDFARAHEDVEYYPSYETVALSDRRVAFKDDLHHVADPIVDVIVARFVSLYADGADADPDAIREYAQKRMARHDGDVLAENAALRQQLGEAERRLAEKRARQDSERFDRVHALREDGVVVSAEGRVPMQSPSLVGSAEVGERAGGEYIVSGWAADKREPEVPAGVVVFVGGRRAAFALTSIKRADIEKHLGLPRPDAGFRFAIPAPEERREVVRVFAVSSAGEVNELTYFEELYRLPRG